MSFTIFHMYNTRQVNDRLYHFFCNGHLWEFAVLDLMTNVLQHRKVLKKLPQRPVTVLLQEKTPKRKTRASHNCQVCSSRIDKKNSVPAIKLIDRNSNFAFMP